MGNLIPAGTGMPKYRHLTVCITEAGQAAARAIAEGAVLWGSAETSSTEDTLDASSEETAVSTEGAL
jgi:hypothetical protein